MKRAKRVHQIVDLLSIVHLSDGESEVVIQSRIELACIDTSNDACLQQMAIHVGRRHRSSNGELVEERRLARELEPGQLRDSAGGIMRALHAEGRQLANPVLAHE